MEHRAASDFWRAYEALPKETQLAADKQFALLKTNAHHPSLSFKKIGQRKGRVVWSVRVSLSYRALALRTADGYLWFWIGDHRTYDALIS